MRKKKALTLFLCVVLVTVASVFGTLAFLTDTDEAVNTFTFGQVYIAVNEAKVNLMGQPLDEAGNTVANVSDASRVKSNNYRLVPGHTYVKDPTLTVFKGSEESYVRMLITINKLSELDAIFASYGGADLLSIFGGYNPEKWIYAGETREDNAITYEFRYVDTVTPGADTDLILEPVFSSFTLPGEITDEDLQTLYANSESLQISVVGNAIQASGFADEDSAWSAFDKQESN